MGCDPLDNEGVVASPGVGEAAVVDVGVGGAGIKETRATVEDEPAAEVSSNETSTQSLLSKNCSEHCIFVERKEIRIKDKTIILFMPKYLLFSIILIVP